MLWISAILSLSVPLVVLVGYLSRRKSDGGESRGIGWQFIRYTVIGIALPITAVLALNDALSSEAATILAGTLGYAFGNAGSQPKTETKENASQA